MRINEDVELEKFYDINPSYSTYRIKDIVFNIMLSGVTSIPGIVMELSRQGCWGKEWRASDVRKLLAGD